MVPGNLPSQLEILSTGQTYYETDLLQSSWHLDESEGMNEAKTPPKSLATVCGTPAGKIPRWSHDITGYLQSLSENL